MTESDWGALLSAATGGALIFWRGKRRFQRLNQLGKQQFTSYTGKLRNRAFDLLLLSIGGGALLAGCVILLMEHAQPLLGMSLFLGVIWLIQEIVRKPHK